jgi:hypothetical protein
MLTGHNRSGGLQRAVQKKMSTPWEVHTSPRWRTPRGRSEGVPGDDAHISTAGLYEGSIFLHERSTHDPPPYPVHKVGAFG